MISSAQAIQNRATFDHVRYANVWEDGALLLKSLAPLQGKRMVSICSAGDNALALLSLDPSEMLVVDLNAAQIACLELRMAAMRALDRDSVLAFLGFTPPLESRLAVYQNLRSQLTAPSRAFWDNQKQAVEAGVIHAGRFESYLRLFGKRVLPLLYNQETRAEFIEITNSLEQTHFYDARWNHRRWRLLFRLFFSRWMMGHLGRDPEFFRYVEGNVSEKIFERAELTLRYLPGKNNPWLHYIVNGNFGTALPPYLEADIYPKVRDHLGAIRIVQGDMGEALSQKEAAATGFNLSDIFEYMNPQLFREVSESLLQKATFGSRFAYWNMLVPRSMAQIFPEKMMDKKEFANALFQEDRAFFYSAFHVDEVV